MPVYKLVCQLHQIAAGLEVFSTDNNPISGNPAQLFHKYDRFIPPSHTSLVSCPFVVAKMQI